MNNLLTSIPAFAVLTSVVMLWGQIRDFLNRCIRMVIVEAQVNRVASEAVLYYMREKGKKLPTNIMKYSSRYEYIKKEGREKLMAFEAVRDLKNQWYWYKGNLVTLTDRRGQDKETNLFMDKSITIRYLRGTIDIEDLICKAIDWYEATDSVDNARIAPRFTVTRYVGTSSDKNSPQFTAGNQGMGKNSDEYSIHTGMNALNEDWKYTRLLNYSVNEVGYSKRDFFHVFNKNAVAINEDVTHWSKGKKWYESKGLLWRRGALLYGPPGSGKSSLIRKVAQSLDLPIFSFELSTMNDQQFIQYWQETRQRQPCIVVMEDIDTVFHKREPANANIKLSFECLLNCISGVEPAEGIYLFVTTNKLEQLDDALGIPNEKGVSTRPGRLDTCFHMGDISTTEKEAIVKHFLSEYPDIGAELVTTSNGCTAAQFSDMCSQKALELYWKKK